jgi:polysaccharide biosynthesis protein PslG
MVLLAISVFSTALLQVIYHPGTTPVATTSGQTSGAATIAPSPSATATPTAKPKPKPAATPQPPAKGYGLSVGNTLPGLPRSELATRLDAFKTIGVGWVRLDLDWNDIQPQNAQEYYWDDFDAVVAAAGARGLKLLPIITYSAPWARLASCPSEPKCAPANPTQYATFAQAAVKRYAPRGIHHWELWNEPNTDGAWMPKANVSAYVQLLKAAYPRIKQADPSAFVVSGGLASSDHIDGIPQLDYLAAIYAGGGGKYFDAVAGTLGPKWPRPVPVSAPS